MTFEVEQKFHVGDPAGLLAQLHQHGVHLGSPQVQADQYFNHFARDLTQTDEALRIRRVGDRNALTYKGPKLDTTTKTRREIEIGIDCGERASAKFAELLMALGFRPVAEVRKQRRTATISQLGQTIEIAVDEIDELGVFVEMECLADESHVETAKAAIADLAAKLGLTAGERKSYLELLLERRRTAGGNVS
jgi:adenylate cyclase class 2